MRTTPVAYSSSINLLDCGRDTEGVSEVVSLNPLEYDNEDSCVVDQPDLFSFFRQMTIVLLPLSAMG